MSLFIKENLLNYRREYYQSNKTKFIERYQNNKDEILKKFKTKRYKCICGIKVGFYSRIKHYESQKHNTRIMLKLYIRFWLGLLS